MGNILELVAALIKVRMLRRKLPFFLGWNLTFRCNLNCLYCGAKDARGEELDAEGICAGLDGLWDLGARWVTFGGGEPLLRYDVAEILRHARKKGYQTFLSTNGLLVPKKLDAVRLAHHVNISLDGPESVHDAIRGNGAFAGALEAIETCKREGIPVSLQCVLSSLNLNAVEETAEIASQCKLQVMYQPATQWLDSSTAPNPIAPRVDEYRDAIRKVIDLKRSGKPVRNSYSGLAHLLHWPDPTRIWCPAGRLMCEIEPDGTLLSCHQAQVSQFLKGEHPEGSFIQRFSDSSAPRACVQCWCAPIVELALLFSLKPEAILNAARTMK